MAETPVKTASDAGKPIAAPAPAAPRRQYIRSALKGVGQLLRYLITLPLLLIRGKRGMMEEVTVYSAHPSFFLWLLIAVGFIAAAVQVARVVELFRLAVYLGPALFSRHAAVRLQYAQACLVGADLYGHLAGFQIC
jgi:hypothetical protein